MSGDLAAALLAAIAAGGPGRQIVALAGPPGSGKSTLADRIARQTGAVVVPMDGYHLDNAVLDARGLRAVKGAPQTFDTDALLRDLTAIRAGQAVRVPVFDRAADRALPAARPVPPDARVVLVEGNWLLLDEGPWRALAPLFDLTALLIVPEPELERRLIARWLAHGHDAAAARARALGNDLPNARRVMQGARRADLILTMDSGGKTGQKPDP